MADSMGIGEAVERVIQLARSRPDVQAAPAEYLGIGPRPFVVVPRESTVVDVSKLYDLPAPVRIVEHVEVDDVASFVAYVRRFEGAAENDGSDQVALFADAGASAVSAVLDYHVAGGPAWAQHVCVLRLAHTPEWQAWATAEGVRKSQEDFAYFLEDNIRSIAGPPGADLAEMVTKLSAVQSGAVRSAIRVTDGSVDFQYTQQIEGTASLRSAVVPMPAAFTLALAAYPGGPPQAVRAALRYRVQDGRVVFWFALPELAALAREAFDLAVTAVGEQLKRPVWRGRRRT